MQIIQKVILCLVFYLTSSVIAVTGDITASPHHLVIDSDQLGSTMISWTTSGTGTAQVWVSAADDTNETLMAAGANGSVNVGWIQSERIYVFSLYEGTEHSNLLAWMSVTSHKPPASNFGFVYWPYQGSCENLIDAEWTDTMKEEVKRDLDHMASFGGRLYRVMFWPQYSGYKLYTDGSGGYFTSHYNEIKNNLSELLSFYYKRDLKVYIAFGNNYFKNKNPVSGLYWWQIAYGTDFNSFMQDSFTWMNGIIEAVEASDYASTVIYYDIETETSEVTLNNWDYWRFMYDNCSIPKGKYGLNPLRTNIDTAIAKAELGNRRFDYIEFHCYPDITYANNSDPQTAYDEVKAYYPDSTAVLGEYGGMGPDPLDLYPTTTEPSTEQTQQATEADVVAWALNTELPYFLHWMLWDRTPEDAENQIAGWGYEYDQPKDVMGKMAEMLGIVPNADMEELNGIEPAHWSGDGTVSVSFVYHTAPATNLLCARLRISQSFGSGWIESELVPVEGGQKLFLNCYIRSSMDNVYMGVREYDSGQSLIATNIGPKIASPQWQWYNYLHATIPWNVTLEADTRYIEVIIGGDVRDNPSLLDVDTVSVWESNMRTVKADFTNDRTVDTDDLEALMLHWLAESYELDWDPRFNIASPPDEIINLSDFAAFCQDWLWQ